MSGKSHVFLRFARPYVRWRMRRAFAEVRIHGLAAVQQQLREGRLLLAPNHVAWWDPLVCVALDEVLGGGGFCLMDAKNLEKMPFFRWVGALPLERSRARLALADLRAAAAQLRSPGSYLIVFPQGKQQPAHLPLQFQRGVAYLAEQTQLPVVPVGLRYDFSDSSKAVLHVSLGVSLHPLPGRDFLAELEAGVRAELARIDVEIVRRQDGGTAAESRDFDFLLRPRWTPQVPRGAGVLAWVAREKRP